MSDYYYGVYTIDGDKITLDKDTIDNLTDLKHLGIRDKNIVNSKSELYLFQLDNRGNVIQYSDEYRVIIDNRKLY